MLSIPKYKNQTKLTTKRRCFIIAKILATKRTRLTAALPLSEPTKTMKPSAKYKCVNQKLLAKFKCVNQIIDVDDQRTTSSFQLGNMLKSSDLFLKKSTQTMKMPSLSTHEQNSLRRRRTTSKPSMTIGK